MLDNITTKIIGHVKIVDKHTREVLVDKDNAVHYGNMSSVIADALTGNRNSFITYMAFGNGGVIVDSTGTIIYRKPNTSLAKNPNAQLYNTTYVQRMTNNADDITLNSGEVSVPGGNTLNYEDVVAQIELEQGFPSGQLAVDSATASTAVDPGTGEVSSADATATYVFNEIGLYVGEKSINLDYNNSPEVSTINFLNNPTTVMITHVIFHPIQKSQNRTLEITYTLRIQLGCD